MTTKQCSITRRTALRGAGVAMALPYLEAMMPSSVFALPEPESVPRFGNFYFGMGMNIRQFFPTDFGPDFTTPRILKPLEKHRGNFTVLSGIHLAKGGGHSGTYPFATGIPIEERQGISVDQLAAEVGGKQTRFPSLQLSVRKGTGFGSQTLGTLSFNRQGVPLSAENDPSALFRKLFYEPSAEEKSKQGVDWRRRRSILDLVSEDTDRLHRKLGKADQGQLDQYLNSVREMEKELERVVQWSKKDRPTPGLEGIGDYSKPMDPDQTEFSYETYARLMYDLIALAFQTDSTRVASYLVRAELRGGTFAEWNLRDYHALTHHGNDPKNLEDLAKADTYYMEHWAHFLNRLQSIKEGDSTLLDHTVLGFGSGMSLGHSRGNLPTMISGGSALGLRHHGHLKLPENTPMANMWHTLLDRVGVEVPERFQDSTGLIDELVA
ncbi:MAG: hypothetical protein ACI8UO_003248 [Verrucomicrobiales bacterium]|jgi:hypothetical protein